MIAGVIIVIAGVIIVIAFAITVEEGQWGIRHSATQRGWPQPKARGTYRLRD